MKKVRKTKEELVEIKSNKKAARNTMFKKSKEKMTREQILLIVAIIFLVILILLLIIMLIFNQPKKVIVPNTPSYKQLDIGLVNYSDKGTDPNDLNIKKQTSLNVNYEIVSDYYQKGIMLSNTKVEYLNDLFVITSGPLSNDSFISTVNKDGNLKFLTKLDRNDFGEFKVYKTIYVKDNYYIVGISTKGNKNNIMVIKVDKDGKIITNKTIKEDIDTKIKDVLYNNETIAIITGDSINIEVYFTNTDLIENKKVIELGGYLPDAKNLYYESSVVNGNILKIAFQTSKSHYIATIELDSYNVNVSEITTINLLKGNNITISGYLNGYVANDTTSIFKLNDNNELINKYDYKNLKLEDENALKEKYKDDDTFDIEGLVNEARIRNITVDNTSIVSMANTSFSSIYDIYDSNLKLTKRIIIDKLKYYYNNGVLLNSFYVGGTIYEIYSYGFETPSIMIAKIG